MTAPFDFILDCFKKNVVLTSHLISITREAICFHVILFIISVKMKLLLVHLWAQAFIFEKTLHQ